MPRNTTDPNRYPDIYHTLWAVAAQDGELSVPHSTKGEAIQMRLELYSLRKAYENANWYIFPRIRHVQIVIRPDGSKWAMIMRSADQNNLVQAAKEALKGKQLKNPITGKMDPIESIIDLEETTPPTSAEPTLPADTTLPGEIKPGEKVF